VTHQRHQPCSDVTSVQSLSHNLTMTTTTTSTTTNDNSSFLPQLVFPLSPILSSSSELLTETRQIAAAGQQTLSQAQSQTINSKPTASRRDTWSLSDSFDSNTLPTHDILGVLDFLEKTDYDIVCEVERLKEYIKEARNQLETYRMDKKTRNKENMVELAVGCMKGGR
jgi:hypothetical protein